MDPADTWAGADLLSPPAYQAGHHWVSPFNFDPMVQSGLAFPRPLTIFDSTLRKILYVDGIRPSIDDMLHIAEALQEVGVREIILNVLWWGDPTPDGREHELCRAVLSRGFAFHTTVSSDLRPGSPSSPAADAEAALRAIDLLRSAGVDTLLTVLSDPGTDVGRARQLERLAETSSYTRSLGMSYVLGVSDIGRTDFEYTVGVANEGIRLGATRINLVDSYSSLSPEAMKAFVSRFKARLTMQVPVTMHVHDDFGLGSATAIAATTAGAHPDVAVNGVSYRSGFAALEEVVISLELLYGIRTGLRLDYLQRLSEIVSRHTGLPNHPLKPVTGPHQFLREFPSWVLEYLRDGPAGFPPAGACFAPSVVGARMRMIWGNHPVNAVIRAKLHQMGLAATEEQIAEIRRRIDAKVQALDSYPRWLTEEEGEAICRAVAG